MTREWTNIVKHQVMFITWCLYHVFIVIEQYFNKLISNFISICLKFNLFNITRHFINITFSDGLYFFTPIKNISVGGKGVALSLRSIKHICLISWMPHLLDPFLCSFINVGKWGTTNKRYCLTDKSLST